MIIHEYCLCKYRIYILSFVGSSFKQNSPIWHFIVHFFIFPSPYKIVIDQQVPNVFRFCQGIKIYYFLFDGVDTTLYVYSVILIYTLSTEAVLGAVSQSPHPPGIYCLFYPWYLRAECWFIGRCTPENISLHDSPWNTGDFHTNIVQFMQRMWIVLTLWYQSYHIAVGLYCLSTKLHSGKKGICDM